MMGIAVPLLFAPDQPVDTINGSVFLVTVHDPICTESGNIHAALYGSFLPVPNEDSFPVVDASEYTPENLPGAIVAKKERIILNQGRERIKLKVTNTGDRPIQVTHWVILCELILIFSSR